MTVEAYCVKCKEKRTIENADVVQMENGRRAAKGKCPVCSTNLTRFLPSEKGEKTKK
jgi:hypothetical protein